MKLSGIAIIIGNHLAMTAPSRIQQFQSVLPFLRGRHFLLLDALAELRTVHKAAGHLNITQSAATKLLAEIETLFGVTLFKRSSRGVEPTKFGSALIVRARRILTEIKRMPEDVDLLTRNNTGVVRVGAFSFAAMVLVPRLIQRLIKKEPGLTIHLHEASPEALLSPLRRMEIDIVVGRIPTDEKGIEICVLGDQPVSIIAGAQHPLAGRSRVTWKMAAAGPWVLTQRGGATRAALEATLAGHGLLLPPAQIETTSFAATETLVEQGMIAMMPFDVAQHMARGRRIAILPLKLEVALPPIGAAWEASQELTPAAELFLDALRKFPLRGHMRERQ
jgi:DNA-binding transcriptional LysR family regulator